MRQKPARQNKFFIKYSVKFCAFMMLMISRIITYPGLQVFYSVLTCRKGSPFIDSKVVCFEKNHLVLTVVSGGSLFILIIFNVITSIFMADLNINSKIPFAGFQNNYRSLSLAPKIFIPLFSIYDFKVTKNCLFWF